GAAAAVGRARFAAISALTALATGGRSALARGSGSAPFAARAAEPLAVAVAAPMSAPAVLARAAALIARRPHHRLEHRRPRPRGAVLVLAQTDRMRARRLVAVLGIVPALGRDRLRGQTGVALPVLRRGADDARAGRRLDR